MCLTMFSIASRLIAFFNTKNYFFNSCKYFFEYFLTYIPVFFPFEI